MIKISICLLIKDENEYLQEWLNHHRNLGISRFYIYDNHSKVPVSETLKSETDCVVKIWDDRIRKTQVEAYNDCCRSHPDDDFILFIDTDEFLMISDQFDSIQSVVSHIQSINGTFSALGLYWRIYGKQEPYFETRQPVENYRQYMSHTHIKTMVCPALALGFVNPHFVNVTGNYISESGMKITGAYSEFHTSSMVWIKHVFTRSISEFKAKMARGSGDKVNRGWNMKHFYHYNDHCTQTD